MTTTWTVLDAFRPEGLLSETLEGYEERPPQRDLALAVEEAFGKGQHLAAEGPTGVGKSLSYLVPAIRKVIEDREAGNEDARCVVVTANIALQEQLVFKDLPFLQEVLPDDFSYELVKGRNNYLCLDKRREFCEERAQLAFGQDVKALSDGDLMGVVAGASHREQQILDWSKQTTTGDRSELDFEPTDQEWRQFSVTAQDCLGQGCPHREQCFATRQRKALQQTDVIVANYHFLFAAIEMRRQTGKDIVLPPFQYLVLDEAHRAADIARDFFGWNVSGYAVSRVEKALRRAARGHDDQSDWNRLADTLAAELRGFVEHLEVLHGDERGALRIRKAGQIRALSLAQVLRETSSALDDIQGSLLGREKAVTQQHRERAALLADELEELSALSDSNGVYFIERFGKSRAMRACKRMKQVGGFLWDVMFSHTTSTVITSATLAIDGSCSFVRNEIGMRDGREIIVDSPFNHREQGLIVLSPNAPNPKEEGYPEKVADVLRYAVRQAGGRTLGLFTSYRVLRVVAEALRADEEIAGKYTILVQGDAPRMTLAKRFKEDVTSILLGTESFWTGVDVPGEALSCLVVDKIPFPSPGEPVLDALSEDAGRAAFFEISVPRAVLQLRQGVGRLIRRGDDRGVVIILDNRLVTKGYGSTFVNSLPRFRRARTLKGGVIGSWLSM